MSLYSNVSTHRTMIFDEVRNQMYARAIRCALQPEAVVLDLGAGMGIHGLIAAAAGARTVHMVDPSPVLLIAEQIVAANGYSESVICHQSSIDDVNLPEKADLLLSVFTGNFLLSEDLLPTLFSARDRFLAKGGRMIPDRARMWVAPVNLAGFYEEVVETWTKPAQGLSFEKVRRFATNSIYFDKKFGSKAEFLADPVCINDIDLMASTSADCEVETELKLTSGGVCHGWLGWMDIRLGDDWLSTAPHAPDTHWSQAWLPLEKPLNCEVGDRIQFNLNRPEYGEWAWLTSHNGKKQRQSTFLSSPVAPGDVLKRSQNHQPVPSDRGKAALYTLSQMDGELRTADLVPLLCARFPRLFISNRHAKQFVDELIRKYS